MAHYNRIILPLCLLMFRMSNHHYDYYNNNEALLDILKILPISSIYHLQYILYFVFHKHILQHHTRNQSILPHNWFDSLLVCLVD